MVNNCIVGQEMAYGTILTIEATTYIRPYTYISLANRLNPNRIVEHVQDVSIVVCTSNELDY
jgi:hypothetical protein